MSRNTSFDCYLLYKPTEGGIFMYKRMKMLLGGLILSTGLVVATPVSYAAERYRLKTILKKYKKYAGKNPIHRIKF